MEAVGYAILDLQTLLGGFAFGFIVFCAACFVVINESGILRRRNVMIAGAILLFGLVCAPQIFQAWDGTIPADYNHYRRDGSLSPTEMIIMGKLFGAILGGFIGIWLFKKKDK
ncbi:hypothetical protein VU677_22065 [Hafnia paralvei]|uniref:hypothetical protein n=1 Tax=Hafnia paralvei TaxID=546367 RepID=UPI00300CBA2F